MHVQFVGEPDDGICVSSHHARALAVMGLDISFACENPFLKGQSARPDVIHLVTFEQLSNALLRHLVAARMAGTQIARYWTGRDLVWAAHHAPAQDFARAVAALGAVQLCRSTEMAAKLASLGIHAKALPVISRSISSSAAPRGLPEQFTILSYLPRHRCAYHGGEIVGALIEKFPLARFLILGDEGRRFAHRPNVEWLQHCTDSVRAIHRSTIVVDPRADAELSRIALEGLCHGRQVIAGYHLPYAYCARSTEEFVEAIRTVRDHARFNLEGRSFVSREHEQHAAAKALRRELEDVIEPGRLNLVLEGGFRGAAAALRNPQLLSPHTYTLPDPTELSEEARALSALLQDMPQPDPVLSV